MLQSLIARFLAIIFLIEVVFPTPLVRAASAPDPEALSREISRQVSNESCVPQAGPDETLRARDPFRQTDLAKEIVCKHQQGAKNDSRNGFASRLAKEARQQAGPMQIESEVVAESTNIRRPPLPSLPSATREPARPTDPYQRETVTVRGGMKTTIHWRDSFAIYDDLIVKELENRIKEPDFTFGDLLDFIDPYEPSGYDPKITAVAADALNVWLQYIHTNAATGLDVVEGVAFYASEIEQRVLYRLAFLENKSPVESRSIADARAIGSLRVLLESLHTFHDDVFSKHTDIFAYYNRDTIFSIRQNGKSIGNILFNKTLNEISKVGATLDEDEPGSTSFTLINTLISYAVMQALLRDQSGTLLNPDGSPIPTSEWNSVSLVMNRIDLLTTDRQRVVYQVPQVPVGSYLQTASLLYSGFAASLQQNLTEKDLTGERGAKLVALLKEHADFARQKAPSTTPSVVISAELASFLLRERKFSMSAEDKKYFANAVESVYCRSSLGHQSELYNAQGVKQDLGQSISGLKNMAELHFESFGFEDVGQHAEFMRGLAKIHQSFGTPRTVFKKVDPTVDRLVRWEEGHSGTSLNRKYAALPPGDFYFKCVLDNNYQRNAILASRETAKIVGAVLVEILTWIAFDGAFRVVGRFVSPLFRSGVAGIQALPRAVAAVGKNARTGRLAGLAAGGRELRDAVVLASKMSQVEARGGSILAVSSKGYKTYTHTVPGRLALPGPGVDASVITTPHAVEVETVGEMIPSIRPWTNWRDPRNRKLFGFGPMRSDVEAVILRQGEKTITLNMRALGLEKGIHTLGDWERMMTAAANGGFKFEPLTGAALRAARAESYMAARAAQKVSAQNWLTSNLPGATKYWKYGGEDVGWVRITQKEFVDFQEGLVRNRAQSTGVITGSPAVLENYYAILGVPRNATLTEIRDAWRHQALLTHPDRLGNEALNKKINMAYDILRDPVKRANFDRMLDLGGQALIEDPSHYSLAITLNGKVFDGTNGIGFGSASAHVEDLVGTVEQYMKDHNLYSSFRVNLSKLPAYWQGSYYSVTRFLPAMYGADYLLQGNFRRALSGQIEQEQNEVLAPFQTQLQALNEKQEKLQQENPMLSPFVALHDKVSQVEPLVGTWLGMPYLSFAGSSLGAGLYHTWHSAIEPFSPWKLHLINQENRQLMRDNAAYALAQGGVQEALSERLETDSVESLLRPIQNQREEYVAQFSQQYGEAAAQEVRAYWDNFENEMRTLLGKHLSEQETDAQIARLNERLDMQLQRCSVLAQISSEKEEFMASFRSLPPDTQTRIASLYGNYEKEVRGILAKNKDNNKIKKLIEKAGERLWKRVSEIPGVSAAMIQTAQDPFMSADTEAVEDIPDYFAYLYQNFLNSWAAIYPDEVIDQLTPLSGPTLARMDEIVANTTLTEAQKREQLRTLQKETFDRAAMLLRTSEPDYNRQFARVRQEMTTYALGVGDPTVVARVNALVNEREEQMQALLERVSTKTADRRKEEMNKFFTEFGDEFTNIVKQ